MDGFLIWTPFAVILSSENPILKKSMDLLGYGYQIIIRFVAIYLYMVVLLYSNEKLRCLNTFLKMLNNEDALKIESKLCRYECYKKERKSL